jgi:YidC/Oxa1 family membrane protein insertase
MANMRRLAPELTRLKELYGDDKQKMNEAMMGLYKKEKVNPLGGCLPILVQIPVFIALYWVLVESVQLRQAPFMLWIKDMSIPDPYYVLPLIMGVTMFIQQKLSPAPPDPMQAKVMMALADRVHVHVPVVPVRAGAVLGGEQHAVHCPAVGHYQAGGVGCRRRGAQGQRKSRIGARRTGQETD